MQGQDRDFVAETKAETRTYRGTVTIADDFDARLPQEILDAFEGVTEEKRSKPSSK